MHQFLQNRAVSTGKGEYFPLFEQKTFSFLQDLDQNNSTEWFDAHRQRYESDIVKPTRSYIAALAPYLSTLQPNLDVSYRVNTTVMRINRDRRFNKTGNPYRAYIKVSFPIKGRKWSNDPVLGFGIFPHYFYVAFRNAGKERQEFVDRYNRNLCKHQALFEQWLNLFAVHEKLMFLGGQHDSIEPVAACSSHVKDWFGHLEPTVGKIWSLEEINSCNRGFFKQTVSLLSRLYFLKMLAISEDLEQDARKYFVVAEGLCN